MNNHVKSDDLLVEQQAKNSKCFYKHTKLVIFVISILTVGFGSILAVLLWPSSDIQTEKAQAIDVSPEPIMHDALCKKKECLYNSKCVVSPLPLEMGEELRVKCICQENYSGERCELFEIFTP